MYMYVEECDGGPDGFSGIPTDSDGMDANPAYIVRFCGYIFSRVGVKDFYRNFAVTAIKQC